MDVLTMPGTLGESKESDESSNGSLVNQKIGFEGTIRGLSGDETVVGRLRELGFVSGHRVVVKGRSPFGDPIVVEVNGTTVALRRGEAQCIQL
ncbi:MAG: ferrous iron transport protein A [Bdellovibrionaceae bacterium]|nr:ferrous iron transport protein A [Pseudobdellovibrionaceae bacterium]